MDRINPQDVRRIALDKMRGHWQQLLLIALIAQIPSLLAMLFLNNMPTTLLDEIMTVINGQAEGVNDIKRVVELMNNWLGTQGLQIILVNLAVGLLQPMLAISVISAIAQCFAKEEPTLAIYPATMNKWLPALGLTIITYLKMLLWALPGVGLTIGAYIWMFVQVFTTQTMPSIAPSLCSLGGMLTAVMTIMAYFRYMLAPYALVDQEIGIMAAIRESKRLTKKRKLRLFLSLSIFYLLFVVGMMLSSIIADTVGYVVSDVIWLFAQLVLIVYSYAVTASFYYESKKETIPV